MPVPVPLPADPSSRSSARAGTRPRVRDGRGRRHRATRLRTARLRTGWSSARTTTAVGGALLAASLASTAREVRDHCWDRRGLAVTAVAVAACLVVTDAAPRAAVAAPTVVVAPGPVLQDYRAPGALPEAAVRAGYTVDRRAATGVHVTRIPGAAEAVARPVAGTIPSAGNFGGRTVTGCAACSTSHQGTDFAAASGTPVFAVMSGTVESAGVLGGYGNQVLLRHADGTETRYGHLSVVGVRAGQVVTVGQQIGAVGSTGVSTGPHLHFEVITGGRAVDPEPWLTARGVLD
ncbi:M23 family metallopeptidase [Curtobacterium aetherium]|uniref:M23 family metallopeptidase n=1 Tax=Curtobacterium aetherium TaxID=2841594 RepID=A0ACD1E164_9MICO|nr:M23 family metallopeptidase [Curtobacterium sp. L6-1]QWS32650.1 M23 family metallopeptidase [Curtobacterium sp. L6-1]